MLRRTSLQLHTLFQPFQMSSCPASSKLEMLYQLRLVSALGDSGDFAVLFVQGVDSLHLGCVQLVQQNIFTGKWPQHVSAGN